MKTQKASKAAPAISAPSPLDFVESDLPPGLSVIEASAGTGKTYAISHLVPRLLLDGTVRNIGQILLVTFTNDAARELSDRVRRVLEKLASPAGPGEEDSDEGIHKLRTRFSSDEHRATTRQALIDIDRLTVSTIHSFCQRTLQAEGTLCGLPVMPEVITAADDFIEEALHDLWQERIATDPLLALLASTAGWKIHEDIGFVKKAISMDGFKPVPQADSFGQTLERIRNAPREFTKKIRDELRQFIEAATTWNKSGGDEQSRTAHMKALDSSASSAFWDALAWIGEMEKHIPGRGAAGKALKAQAAALQAVALAHDLVSVPARLRWSWQNECVRSVHETVQSALHSNRQITQDGLILALRDALRSAKKEALAGRLRQRYKVALIDESQDTDPRQFEIFKHIFIGFVGQATLPDQRLIMIGDPKQAIYGFRGADVNTYLDARNEAEAIFTLTTTYRAPQPLVEAINTFFTPPDSLLKDGLGFYPAKSGKKEDTQLFINGKACTARVEAWLVPEANAEKYSTGGKRRRIIPATVASQIVRLLKSGALGSSYANSQKVKPGDIAVLTNSNMEAELMAVALKDRGVPAIVASGADVMESEEAAELLCILRAVNEPRRSSLRYAALATRLLGRTASAIQGIRLDSVKDDATLDKFLQWQSAWARKGIAAAIALMDHEADITPRLACSALGERRITNFRQLIDVLQTASEEHSNRPEHLLRWLSQEIVRAQDNISPDERQIQLESDSDAVQVVTMHKAKGLEYDLVFCPYLWALREPGGIQSLARSAHDPGDKMVNMDLSDDPAIATELRRSGLEDRLRLAYVAMTRAKVRLWLYGGEMGSSRSKLPASPLDWLLRDQTVQIKSPEQFGAWAESAKSPGRGGRHAAGLSSLFDGKKGQLIEVKEPPDDSGAPWNPDGGGGASSLSSLPAPRIDSVWSITSFSSLTREKNPYGFKDPGTKALPEKQKVPAPLSGTVPPNRFNGVSGGMMMGTAIHDWLEDWDFTQPDQQSVREHLKKFHFRPVSNEATPRLDEAVVEMLQELRGSMLPGLAATISQASPDREASEWHFHLPIKATLNPHQLAAVFARHGGTEGQSYAAMIEMLSAADLQGFLQGFIDRLVFHQEHWGVIDWKTNKLGELEDAYSHASMLDCAMHSHYLLQAHLYLVALRRYLKLVAPHDTMAGAWLVFLRAVRAGTAAGVLHINPSDGLLAALDELFLEGEQPLVQS